MHESTALQRTQVNGNLGTFAGVFTPSLLTILGIILFLRLGYVVGGAGLERALVIIGMANAISVLTSISLAAVATNLKVKSGGDYYLISRTLGVEFGGAIGVVLFLAQSVSIAFYCIGFGEVLNGLLPREVLVSPQVIAGSAVAFLMVFAWLGADWATRLQFLIMGVLIAALVSFFVGGFERWDSRLLAQSWETPASGMNFWVLFAIFFPAVTGFTQGVSMSGDLKDAGKSIPLGTFLAVGVSIIVYLGATVVLAAALPVEELRRDYEAMRRVAHTAWVIDAGVIAATLSSGMASFLGAPRILQSLARDQIFPLLSPFAVGAGPTENPRRGVLLSAGLALVTIALGNLNVIAPVVSMFFLISYGLLNYATFYAARAASPSFRPRFRWFDARLSLLGALGCFGIMVAIDLAASVVGIAVLFAIYQYLQRTAGPARWADSRRSYHLQRVRAHLLAVTPEPEHPRDWRPCILAFCDESEKRLWLLRFASWIEGGSGLSTAVYILEGEGERVLRLRKKTEQQLQEFVAEQALPMFARVLAAPDFQLGIESLFQAFGLGEIRANMILLSRTDQHTGPEDSVGRVQYRRLLQGAARFGCNVVVLDAQRTEWAALEQLAPEDRKIDVWWWGGKTSQLMLLLAYLMTRSSEWSGAAIRVLAPSSEQAAEKTRESLQHMLEEVRIDATPEVVFEISPEAVIEHSAESTLVFLPLRFQELQLLGPRSRDLENLFARLPVVALTLAAEDVDLDAEPEEGKETEEETEAPQETPLPI
ncbi:MAG: amino acid permease [Candidatus Binatia bacterium]